jgi:deoxycytidylate deaminase
MYDECPSIHAEANALLYVDRSSVEGGTLYVTGVPCMQCAKLISNSGIRRIVCTASDADAHRKPELVFKYLANVDIDCTVVWQRTENDNS